MLDMLRELALVYTSPSGCLTLAMLPFSSYRVPVIYETFEAIVPREQWNGLHYSFVNFVAFALDVQVAEGASPVERVFGVLWRHRDDELSERWALWQQVYYKGVQDVFDRAFDATRDHTYDAPPILQSEPGEDADPNSSAPTPTPSKGSSRGAQKR